jgi:hypothetical protein
MNYADLAIGLHHRNGVALAVAVRFTQPDSDVDTGLGWRMQPVARIDFPRLLALEGDALEYGHRLNAGLFALRHAQQLDRQAACGLRHS